MNTEIKENKELVLFENNKIRRKEYNDEWYYSIVDIIEILTESKNANDYWYRLKKRMTNEENSEVSTNCRKLKIPTKSKQNKKD